MEEDSTQLSNLLASKFIQRKDVKAVQKSDAYIPDRSPWTRGDLLDHLSGRKSLGHYLVGTDGDCKLFAFDIDLTKWSETSGRRQPTWIPIEDDGTYTPGVAKGLRPRDAWLHPEAPPELRRFLTAQLRGISDMLANIVADAIGVPVAVSYSGGKGLHVYGFTGAAPAHDVRGAAMEVMKLAGCFEPYRGSNFFMHKDDDPRTGFGCIDVEVFPKQDDISDKDLGNLMRLPLGTHAKTKQKAYMLNLNSHVDQLVEADPVIALEGGNPWL